MTDSTVFQDIMGSDLPDQMTEAETLANRHTEAALERHKREGMELAVRARWGALAVVAVMIVFLNPGWEMLYHHVVLGLLALVGLLQRRVARVGRSRMELTILFLDLLILTFALALPNPFSHHDWPTSAIYKFEGFQYFYIILAAGTMAYSWRTILAIGIWTSGLWMAVAVAIWWFGTRDTELTAGLQAILGDDPDLMKLMDPSNVNFDLRIQQVVVFLVISATLALSIRRFSRLLLSNAALERERENLSRYFSPNVVEELSQHDEPLKRIQSHDVAVLFVDIADFTAYSSGRDPVDVIDTLREFHAMMEKQVFRHNGTLDKYLGDGLMATFGTPVAGETDATNALRCARDMQTDLERWNRDRARRGDPQIVAGIGVHFGPVVLADIGTSRLEFAVVGDTVNVASRIEKLTRELPGNVAISDATRARVIVESGKKEGALADLVRHQGQSIRGVDHAITVWASD
ncbi:MAG: adenylate/guanylate cyclase domain-containing protein [Paracoccaceae bacterium]